MTQINKVNNVKHHKIKIIIKRCNEIYLYISNWYVFSGIYQGYFLYFLGHMACIKTGCILITCTLEVTRGIISIYVAFLCCHFMCI